MRGITIHPDTFNGTYPDEESLLGWDFVLRMWGDNILLVTVVLANGAIAEISEVSLLPSLALTTSLRFHTHLVPTSIATQPMKAYQQFALSPNLTNHIGTDFQVLKQVSERGV
ncbi:hypothetical protein D9758_018061 [Tetrapyrgos nigripes]|uniref:Uncharacterized protein n=1 Tax=Tetrapyrgos nigripes TaxID=182062 RepID=A0A8H5BJA3_9AGAR|nr:hypothetical protein D9758_018061 [Tetrapyrgos nigripes]